MDLVVDRHRDVPLREQIASAIRDKIRRGDWVSGSRLPSGRELAERLRVNRATVQLSLRDLQDEGWIESDVGRGTYVLGLPRPTDERADFDWSQRVATAALGDPAPRPSRELIPLSHAISHSSLYPVDELRAAFDRAFERLGSRALVYPSTAGWEPLRQVLSRRCAARGIDMDRNEVLIVNGSQQGLDLVGRLLSQRGRVLTSDPTFSGALEVFHGHGATTVGCPLDEQGLDVEAVGREIRGADFVYTLPSRHNPTGVDLAPERGDALLALSRSHGVPILEDDWLEELREQGGHSLKSRDRCGLVLSLSTSSKVLAPGLRVGWLVVPRPLVPALLDLKRRTDLATTLPSQIVLCDLLESGFFDEHLPRVRAAFEARRRIVDETIDRCFPAAARPLRPHSGMVCWVRLPPTIDVSRLVAQAAARGVELAPASPFDPSGGSGGGFRIAHAAAPLDQLGPALQTVGAVLTELLGEEPTPAGPALV